MHTYPPAATTTTDSPPWEPPWGSGQPPWMLTRTAATPPDARRGRDRRSQGPRRARRGRLRCGSAEADRRLLCRSCV